MKYLPFFLCVLIAHVLPAQDYDKMAQLTCDCIATKDPSGLNQEEATAELGFCLIKAAQDAGFEVDFSDSDAMTKLGEAVGAKMVGICLDKLLAFTQGDASSEEETVEGKIRAVETGDFVFIVLKETSGKESKYLWLRYFEGSDEYLENPKSLSGKEVTLTFSEIECYVPKANGYFKHKEITSLVVK